MPTAWVLNFDAEEELAAPRSYSGPRRAAHARFRTLESRLGGLLAPGDIVLCDGDPPGSAEGFAGDAWCPTPWALARLARAGAAVPTAPSLEALRRANHRGFCAELGQTLPGAVYTCEEPAVLRTVRAAGVSGEWLLKRPFGFAGRGRRKVSAGELSPADRAWVRASLRGGEGLQVEPWVARDADFALHGRLAEGGALRLGRPTVQSCDRFGAWTASAPASEADLSTEERAALLASAETAAHALAALGYFGPFGVDAYRWRDGDGATRFQPRSEVNARYSMGWAMGMAR
jgi:hypothetical protein